MFSFLLHEAKIYGFLSYEIKREKNKLRVGYTTSDVKSVTHQKSISQAGITCVTMFGRTLWKGPRICSPAYDLKFRLTKCVIIRRGAPGSLVIAGGGGGGMLPTISSKLLLSTVSVPSPWDESVAHKKYNFYSSVRVVSGGGGGDSCTWGRGREAYSRTHTHTKKKKQTNKTHAPSYKSSQSTTPERKVDRRYFPLFCKQEPTPKKKETMAAYERTHIIIQTLSTRSVCTYSDAPHCRWQITKVEISAISVTFSLMPVCAQTETGKLVFCDNNV